MKNQPNKQPEAPEVAPDSVGQFFRDVEPFFFNRTLTYVDVGAYEGEVTLLLSASKLKIGEAHLFEPNPRSFQKLEKNIQGRMRTRSLNLYNVSVGAKEGEVSMTDAKAMSRVLADDQDVQGQGVFRQRMVSLDSMADRFTEGRISLLKIDVEGHEIAVLDGASQMLRSNRVDVIYLEAGTSPTGVQQTPLAQLDATLEPLGYRKFRIYEQKNEWMQDSPLLRRVNVAYFSAPFAAANPYKLSRELLTLRERVEVLEESYQEARQQVDLLRRGLVDRLALPIQSDASVDETVEALSTWQSAVSYALKQAQDVTGGPRHQSVPEATDASVAGARSSVVRQLEQLVANGREAAARLRSTMDQSAAAQARAEAADRQVAALCASRDEMAGALRAAIGQTESLQAALAEDKRLLGEAMTAAERHVRSSADATATYESRIVEFQRLLSSSAELLGAERGRRAALDEAMADMRRRADLSSATLAVAESKVAELEAESERLRNAAAEDRGRADSAEAALEQARTQAAELQRRLETTEHDLAVERQQTESVRALLAQSCAESENTGKQLAAARQDHDEAVRLAQAEAVRADAAQAELARLTGSMKSLTRDLEAHKQNEALLDTRGKDLARYVDDLLQGRTHLGTLLEDRSTQLRQVKELGAQEISQLTAALATSRAELNAFRGATAARDEERANQTASLLKQLVRAERVAFLEQKRRERIESRYDLALGEAILEVRGNPWRALGLPMRLLQVRRTHHSSQVQHSEPAMVRVTRALENPSGDGWRPMSLIAARPDRPDWIELPVTKPGRVLRMAITCASVSVMPSQSARLLLRFEYASGQSVTDWPAASDWTPEAEYWSYLLPACCAAGRSMKIDVPLPTGCARMGLAFVQAAKPEVIRIQIDSLAVADLGIEDSTKPMVTSSGSDAQLVPPGAKRQRPKPSTLPPGSAPAKKPRQLRALSLFDPFSEQCFAPELDLARLDRKKWRTQISSGEFDLFLAESVWRGNGQTWNYCMTKPASKAGQELKRVLSACRRHNLPTVFWNKEDPANFDVFIEIASQFDFVFTTDVSCIPRYREILGHERVNVLPFAAQPSMHNPVLPKSRIQRVAFAGSWAGGKYPNRAAWLQTMLGATMEKGLLDIYDRHAKSEDSELRFPDAFQPAVIGSVGYEEIAEKVYKRYAVMINVNSVADSPTMVARRIFELAACGTPLISSPSPAISGEMTTCVDVARDASEMSALLDMLLGDELASLRRSVNGVRIMHEQHTYAHRVDAIRRVLHPLEQPPEASEPSVTAICVSRRPEFLTQIADMINKQNYRSLRVIFVAHGEGFDDSAIGAAFDSRLALKVLRIDADGTVLADGLNLALDHVETDFVAKIDDDDYYGPNYLRDAMLAFRYSDAAVVGKGSYFCYMQQTDETVYRFPGKHYRYRPRVHGGTLVWHVGRTEGQRFERVRQGTDSAFLQAVHSKGGKILSTDPFNFVHVRYADLGRHTWKIEDEEFLRNAQAVGKGLLLQTVFA